MMMHVFGRYPQTVWPRRVRFDAALLAGVVFVTADRLTGNPVHEWGAVLLLLMLILHNAVNVGWYGHWKKGATVTALVNVFLILSFVTSFVSGLLISQSVLAPILSPMTELDVRVLHTASSCWFAAFAAIHAGLHAGAFRSLLPARLCSLSSSVVTVVQLALLAVGLAAAVGRKMHAVLGFETAFIPIERDEWTAAFPLELILMTLGLVSLGALIRRKNT